MADYTPAGPSLPSVVAAFGDAAGDYELARPGYPDGVADLLVTQLGLGPGVRVCDLAAGTGKFTRVLLDLGCEVVAVEPVDGMRAQLTAVLPDVVALDGSAEHIPLDEGSVDAVSVAQAFHWFDAQAALAEINRVLRPGGGLVMVWNVRDEGEPWVAEMSRVLHWHERRIPGYKQTSWKSVVADSDRFTSLAQESVPWNQPMTRDLLAARVRSISYVADAEPERQQRYVDDVVALVEGFPSTFPLPYRADVYWCHRR